ncbi:MAG: hypothetical protein KC478_06915 [Bacteriovoracaceae bacterium]|nr:hypothetical protein [Bacteriovoracaceae bacterium]
MKLTSLWLFFLLLSPAQAKLAWKTVIYMQADNDLAPYALWDLREIASSGNNRNRTFVHLDLPGMDTLYEFEVLPDENELSNELEDYKSSSLAEFKLNFISRIEEKNAGSQQSRLLDFLVKIDSEYPTENTMLVIWGHGQGHGGGAQFGGVALDDNPKSKMRVEDIRQSLDRYYEKGHQKISIVAMDACLMQSFEVVSSMGDSSNYFIGSAQIQNFKGLPYHLINDYINTELVIDQTISGANEDYLLAKKIPNLFASGSSELSSETMSSVSSKELHRSFLPSFNKLFNLINRYLESNKFEEIALKSHLSQMPFFLGDSRDLSTILSYLESYFMNKGVDTIAKAGAQAQKDLNYSLISYAYGDDYGDEILNGYYLGSFKAFGLWLPSSKEQYELRINQFRGANLYKNKYFQQYRLFLEKLYEQSLF